MGQTLTHGIYLPDEGERNCYNGLAANWQLLDGAVGTVAEHTTALAGKAPLVHTHTKADITDFPAYGTTAGTICEGNDSRLSDARTPVAHTHTKSDVTDLLNSDFIPSVNNSYDLGSSSYQWNNIYAKNYYYNGTAWGLDKANTWTDTQTYSAGSYGQKILLKNTGLDLSVNGNTGLSSTYQHVISWVDKNNTIYSSIQSWASDANTTLVLRSNYRTDANTSRNLSVRFVNTATDKSIYSETNADTNLGTSTSKWKTLNGVNPGALSLPSENASSVNLDPTNWNITGTTANRYTPPADGWLGVQVMSKDTVDLTGQYLFVGRATGGSDYYPEGGTTSINVNSGQGSLMGQVFIPVISGKEYHIRIKIGVNLTNGSSITARFYTCQGNV